MRVLVGPFTLTISSSNPDANGEFVMGSHVPTVLPRIEVGEFAVGSFDVDDTISTVFGAGASTFTINDETISVIMSTTLSS